MARKTKRQRTAARNRPRPAAAPPPAAAGSTVGPVARPAARTGGSESLVRSVELSLAPRQAGAGRRQRGFTLDADPAIPLDRVPYFTSDLRNLGVVAVLMVVLLFIGSRLIPLVVH